ncbi:MAG: flavin reductase family protein [Hyphomonadaceae bacterium]|nr:flavin reductase family protein [Hyphomonadaceae bacterium]
MRRLASGVSVITTANKEAACGLTATAVCSLSAQPPRILCCVNQKGETFRALKSNQNFCVNLLSSKDQSVARRFAGMDDLNGEDRFAEGHWTTLSTGAPALLTAVTSLDCTVEAALDYQTHAVIIGQVVDVRNENEIDPLLWLDGAFAELGSKS